jgi:hypothetical protein
MALMLVVAAVAAATVLSYAVLANTSTNARVAETSTLIAQADALAESGVNYAIYNLAYPANAPAYTGSYWGGTSSPVSLGSSVPGTFSVTVSGASGGPYTIVSTASVPGEDGSPVARQVTAVVAIATGFGAPNQAAGFNGPLTVGSNWTINGQLNVSGAVSLTSGATVDGSIVATSLSLNGATAPTSFTQLASSAVLSSPTTHTDYTTYVQNGVTYSATLLTTDPAAGTVLGPTANNPAGIYYTSGRSPNLKGVTINGSLLVKGTTATVTVKTGTTNTITPVAGYPGLVVDNTVTMNSTNSQLTVNGLMYAGAGVIRSGTDNTGSNLTVNGALMVPGSSAIATNYNGHVTLNYNAQNASVPTFSTQMQVPTNISVQSWTP